MTESSMLPPREVVYCLKQGVPFKVHTVSYLFGPTMRQMS